MSNVGRLIRDFYCNGFFGRVYDLTDAVIIAEGPDWIIIQKENRKKDFTTFHTYTDKQEYIDNWCRVNDKD